MPGDVSDAQAAQYHHNELGNMLLLAHLITDEYVAHYSYHFIISESNVTK